MIRVDLEAPPCPGAANVSLCWSFVWDAHLGPGALGRTGFESRNPCALAQAVELRTGPTCWLAGVLRGGRGVGVGLHTPGPGALGVTGIELKEPVALAFGLSSLPPMHGPMDPGLRAV